MPGQSGLRITKFFHPTFMVRDLSEAVAPFPAGTEVCTIHFKVAAGPWSTVLQTSGRICL